MSTDAIIRELQARVATLERDARLVRREGGSGAGFSGEVWFPSGVKVTGLRSDSAMAYVAVYLHNETAEQVAVIPEERPDGVLYYEKRHTPGHVYVPRT